MCQSSFVKVFFYQIKSHLRRCRFSHPALIGIYIYRPPKLLLAPTPSNTQHQAAYPLCIPSSSWMQRRYIPVCYIPVHLIPVRYVPVYYIPAFLRPRKFHPEVWDHIQGKVRLG